MDIKHWGWIMLLKGELKISSNFELDKSFQELSS